MRILHFDFDDLENPAAGGQAVRTFEINRRLVKMGHEVTVITMNYPGAVNKTKDGVKYERMGLKSGPKSYISYCMMMPWALWTHKFDLVVEDNISPFTFGLSPLYIRKPVISQVQCFFAKQSSKKHHLPFWAFEKYGAKIYKNFIVLTKNMESKIRILNKKARIKIIPNGINKIAPQSHQNQNYFLFIGRISFYQKGLAHLLKIAEILAKNLPHYKIIIAGKGEDETKLLDLIKTKSLKNVKYIGKTEGVKKEDLLKNCTALLLPSTFEIFPFTILEAASHGKPTICFDIPNLQEIIAEKIGLMAPAFDINIFAKLATDLANSQQLQMTLSQNAHRWAEHHLWDDIVQQQLKFYESAAKN